MAGLGYMPKCTLSYDPCCLSAWNYWYLFLPPFTVLLIVTKVCAFLEGAFEIKLGLSAGASQTDVAVPLNFEIILAIALLVTNGVSTLMILHKTWYHICLSVAYQS